MQLRDMGISINVFMPIKDEYVEFEEIEQQYCVQNKYGEAIINST